MFYPLKTTNNLLVSLQTHHDVSSYANNFRAKKEQLHKGFTFIILPVDVSLHVINTFQRLDERDSRNKVSTRQAVVCPV